MTGIGVMSGRGCGTEPSDLRVPNVRVGAGERRLRRVGDHGGPVHAVKGASLERVRLASRQQVDAAGRGDTLEAIGAHTAPLTRRIGEGLSILPSEEGSLWVPPADCPVMFAEGRHQRTVNAVGVL